MGSLEELLSNINSGAVDLTAAAAAKRQPRKPKAQTDLSKRLRGQANAVNNSAAAAAAAAGGSAGVSRAEKRAAAVAARASATPPPTASAPVAPAPAAVAAAPPPVPVAVPSAPAGPPPLAVDAPLTMRLKRVLDLLRSNRDAHTHADVRARLGVDLDTDMELLDQLMSHTHVTYDTISRTLRYKPKVPGISNANELLTYLRRHTTVEGASSAVPMSGVRMADVADAYLNVLDDIKRLQVAGELYVFGHGSPGNDTIYAVQDMKIGPLSESVIELFHNTKLPIDVVDLQWRVRDMGLRSALASRPVRKREEQGDKKKKRRKTERRFNVDKATNAHMRELFEGAQPKNIDTR